MVKLKRRQGKDKRTQAQEAARALVKRREALKSLRENVELSPVDRITEAKLLREIEDLKKRIKALGFDPVLAASAAAAIMVKEGLRVRAKGSKLKVRSRSGGVGMYGLGSTIKVWR